jgi:hypothetical protein
MAETDFTRNIEQSMKTEFEPLSCISDDFLEVTYNFGG